MTILMVSIAGVLLFLGLLYAGRGYASWTVTGTGVLGVWAGLGDPASGWWLATAGALAAAALVFGVPVLRRCLIAAPFMRIMKRVLPRMSETERIALEAGTVWWDKELFSGRPDWSKLLDFDVRELTDEERTFLDGPVEKLCAMLDDWTIHRDGDMPPKVWNFIRNKGFFGLVIPREYGGLGFSAQAHSAVVTKVASRSVAAPKWIGWAHAQARGCGSKQHPDGVYARSRSHHPRT